MLKPNPIKIFAPKNVMTKSWLSWRENCYLSSSFREVATLDFLDYVAKKYKHYLRPLSKREER